MQSIRTVLLLVPALLLDGCGREPAQPAATPVRTSAAPPQARALPDQLPALYAGVLPCADCPGIRHELDLRADRVFFLRRTYLGEPAPNVFDEAGQWTISENDVLILQGSEEAPMQLSVIDANSLRLLDREGQPVQAQRNYTLQREVEYAPLEPAFTMRGMYSPGPDQATFEECLSGLALHVSSEGEHGALAAAYAKLRRQPETGLLAQLDGRIVRRPAADGSLQDALIVDRMDRFFPNETCGARGVTHDLESTRWVLVRLGDQLVESSSDQREPYIALEPTEHRVSGHGGCNRLVGSYELQDTSLRFTQLALTRMACPDARYENAFARALQATASWKITGNHLELFDAAGTAVARFEERNL